MTAAAGTNGAVVASEMRSQAPLGLIGLAILTLTSLGLWLGFRSYADPHWFADAWLIGVLALNATLFLLIRHFNRTRPSDAEVNRVWLRPMLFLYPAMTLMVVIAPWVLMINAPVEARTLGIALIPWYLAVSLLTTSAAQPVPAAGLASVAVSGAVFALVTDVPYAPLWALMLLAACASMVALRDQARRDVVQAVENRLAVEAAAAETRLALAVAAAEREAKVRFIASASHDLKQPLSAAQLWARIGLDAAPGAARNQALDKAEQAFAAAVGLVDSMLDHMRLEAGAEVARIEAVAVGPILQASAEAFAPAAAAAGLAIRTVPGRQVAAADPALLRRAIDNLVANALRHSRGQRLLLGTRRCGDGVAIWAIDDGRGLKPVVQARLFEDYTQGTDAGPGGFGLGLSSVKRQLELMGGEAGYDPHWSNGAAFRLWLPAAQVLAVRAAA